jgi:superfamily II helicase
MDYGEKMKLKIGDWIKLDRSKYARTVPNKYIKIISFGENGCFCLLPKSFNNEKFGFNKNNKGQIKHLPKKYCKSNRRFVFIGYEYILNEYVIKNKMNGKYWYGVSDGFVESYLCNSYNKTYFTNKKETFEKLKLIRQLAKLENSNDEFAVFRIKKKIWKKN